MKQLLILLILSVFFSCNTKKKEPSTKADELIDSYNAKKFADSSLQAMREQMVMDTAGIYLSPIQIIEYSVIDSETGLYRNIKAKYKNVSTKKVSAIRFKWYGVNAFNEPSDIGALHNGIGVGESDTPMRPGASEVATWETLSKDLKKIRVFYPYEVMFDDGSKWELKK